MPFQERPGYRAIGFLGGNGNSQSREQTQLGLGLVMSRLHQRACSKGVRSCWQHCNLAGYSNATFSNHFCIDVYIIYIEVFLYRYYIDTIYSTYIYWLSNHLFWSPFGGLLMLTMRWRWGWFPSLLSFSSFSSWSSVSYLHHYHHK